MGFPVSTFLKLLLSHPYYSFLTDFFGFQWGTGSIRKNSIPAACVCLPCAFSVTWETLPASAAPCPSVGCILLFSPPDGLGPGSFPSLILHHQPLPFCWIIPSNSDFSLTSGFFFLVSFASLSFPLHPSEVVKCFWAQFLDLSLTFCGPVCSQGFRYHLVLVTPWLSSP